MLRHTQTIRRQQPANSLSVFDHFVELALEGLTPGNVVHLLVGISHFINLIWNKLTPIQSKCNIKEIHFLSRIF